MTFAHPAYFLLILLLVPYIIWYILRGRKSEPSMRVSTTRMYATMPKSYKVYLRHVPFVLRMIALLLLIVVLARPQSTDSWQSSEVEGIDIMLAVDVSTSMLAEDLKPNRLEAAKQVAADFINGRPNDNIGLTIFAGQSFTQSPLTIDHAVLLNLFNSVSCDMAMNGIIEDGTAIGLGIANAVSPLTAAEIAKTYGIRVYTVGVGSNGTAPYPYPTMGGVQYVQMPVEIDENTLQQIAKTADGQYYRATSNSKLKEVYEEIDKLEKTKLNVKDFSRKSEEYMPFALWAMVCLILEVLLRLTILRRIP